MHEGRVEKMNEQKWTPERVLALRKSQGLSQTQFADALGVPTFTVSRWERKRQAPRGLSLLALERYAQAVGWSEEADAPQP